MKCIIAGCRDYNDYNTLARECDRLLVNKPNTTIISGCATGADKLGERYARERNLEVLKFPADWNTYGLSAGPRRNKQMAEATDVAIVFWDGISKGTKNMINNMKELDKRVVIIKI